MTSDSANLHGSISQPAQNIVDQPTSFPAAMTDHRRVVCWEIPASQAIRATTTPAETFTSTDAQTSHTKIPHVHINAA